MNKFIFDVDGTLTPSRKGMNADFQDFFIEFCFSNHVYLVTGSDNPKTLEQVGPDVLDAVERCYNCNGNDIWEKGVNVYSNDWKLPIEAQEWLSEQLTASEFPLRTGLHFEHRPGMVNFSIVGRNANQQERNAYVHWDIEQKERIYISHNFNLIFPDLQATVGGETGIDIAPLGSDKSQIIKDFTNDDYLYFFGDRMDPDGNDYTLSKIVDHPKPVKGWQDTYSLLKQLQNAGIAA